LLFEGLPGGGRAAEALTARYIQTQGQGQLRTDLEKAQPLSLTRAKNWELVLHGDMISSSNAID
jgi:hypothetical protein